MFPQISHLASYSIAVQEYLSVLQQVKQAIKKQKKRPISELHCIGIKLKHLYVEVFRNSFPMTNEKESIGERILKKTR